jgi:hypothetical protein
VSGKRAKQIRRLIYGDFSHRVRKHKVVNGTVRDFGLRSAYQNAKRMFRRGSVE